MVNIVCSNVTVLIPNHVTGSVVFVRLRDVNLAGEEDRVIKSVLWEALGSTVPMNVTAIRMLTAITQMGFVQMVCVLQAGKELRAVENVAQEHLD